MPAASDYIDPIASRPSVVEDRTWCRGIEIVSHVNYDQLARVRAALGIMPDACGRPFTKDQMIAHRTLSLARAPAREARLEVWTDIMAQITRLDETPPLRLIA